MHESRYLQLFADASDGLLGTIGVDAGYLGSGGSYFTVETHLSHLRQLEAGDRVHVTTQLLDSDEKRLHVFHELLREGEPEPLATAEQMLAPRRHPQPAGRRRLATPCASASPRSRTPRLSPPPRARRPLGRRPLTRDLTPLFEPRSLAVVGVSADPGKWGYWFARDAATRRAPPARLPRRPQRRRAARAPVHRSLDELPEPPELVVLSVPAHGLEEAVDASLAAGARALVAIAAGFGELGDEGAARERALVERVRAAGAMLVGPNCLGVFDAAAELQLASNPLPAGPVGFVSQSGNIVLETGCCSRTSASASPARVRSGTRRTST